MKSPIKLCLQVAWLTSTVVVLLIGFNSCAATDQVCFDAGGRMLLTMLVLSFPMGFLFVLVVILFLGPGGVDYLNDYVVFWLVMAAAGYLQWFVLVPRLFAKQQLITLGIEQQRPITKETAAEAPPRRTAKPARIRLIPAHDRRGRTPLERALGQRL